MSKLYLDENGKIRDADSIAFVDNIFHLRRQKDPWVVIDELIDYWVKRTPEEVEALKINISDVKETLTDKKHGQTHGGKNLERRFQLIFPLRLQQMIRAIYKAEELPFDREFYSKFAKRYPGFRVAEKD